MRDIVRANIMSILLSLCVSIKKSLFFFFFMPFRSFYIFFFNLVTPRIQIRRKKFEDYKMNNYEGEKNGTETYN